MFLIAGISPKISQIGSVQCDCPACNASANLFVVRQSQSISVFFIPLLKISSEYIATCARCASVMELDKDAGKRFEREGGEIFTRELKVMRNNSGPVCPGCGMRVQASHSFCSGCGVRL